jgi:hypothetical protein
MRFIGYITVAILAAAAVVGIKTAVESVPDIKRYLKIRDM